MATTTAFPFRGTAMVPGVSLNRRNYTADVIGKAVRRAQERIDSGGEPLTMLTHHGAEDDSTRIVGRITRIWQESDGRARYTAVLADTDEAQKIRALIAPDGDEPPFLDGVSIRGWWLGEVRTERGPDGDLVTVADDLELDGLDFTRSPGVLGARVEAVGAEAEESAGRVLIYESATVDPPPPPPTPARSPYADLGYHGARRFPLHTPQDARRSWERVTDPAETTGYTPAQLKRMRSRTKAALKEHGVAMPQKTKTTFGRVEEFYGEDGGDAGLSVCAYNGPLTITVSAYGIEAEQLQQVADKAMAAAMDAVAALDGVTPDDAPDDEPDEEPTDDAPMGDEEADDDQMEAAPRPAPVAEQKRPRTRAAATTRREPPVAPTNPAAPSGGVHLTDEQFDKLLARVGGAPATEAAPAEPVVEETAEEKTARLIGEAVAKAVDSLKDDLRAEVQAAGPRRKGLTAKTAEALAANKPDKPLHEMSTDEFNKMAEQGFGAAFGIDVGD